MDPVIVTAATEDVKKSSVDNINNSAHCPTALVDTKCHDQNEFSNSITNKIVEDKSSKVPTFDRDYHIDGLDGSRFITVEEAVAHFQSLNLPKDLNRLQPERTKFSELFRFFKPPLKLNQSLCQELDLIHSIAQCSLDWSDCVQRRMLQAVYCRLTNEDIECPHRGNHWQLIGFQGNDPATDLRAVGLFGVVQLLYLVRPGDMMFLARRLYSVSNSETQPFPLAVLSLNITNIVLNATNTSKLNRECNNRNCVLDVLNSFYAALLVYVLNTWVSQNKTIKDSGYLLKDAERFCCRNVRRVLKELPNNLAKFRQ